MEYPVDLGSSRQLGSVDLVTTSPLDPAVKVGTVALHQAGCVGGVWGVCRGRVGGV